MSDRELEDKIGSKHRYTSKSLLPYRTLQVCVISPSGNIQGIYIRYLFERIMGVEEVPNSITLVKTVNGKNVDWSLGAAVNMLF